VVNSGASITVGRLPLVPVVVRTNVVVGFHTEGCFNTKPGEFQHSPSNINHCACIQMNQGM
jgi:hypothetical protein